MDGANSGRYREAAENMDEVRKILREGRNATTGEGYDEPLCKPAVFLNRRKKTAVIRMDREVQESALDNRMVFNYPCDRKRRRLCFFANLREKRQARGRCRTAESGIRSGKNCSQALWRFQL